VEGNETSEKSQAEKIGRWKGGKRGSWKAGKLESQEDKRVRG
jgi:hypothetical protein